MQKTYVWTEDSGAGFTFWKEMFAQLFPESVVETKKNNSELVKAVSKLNDDSNRYIILMDQAVDNPQVVREQKRLSTLINGKKNIICIKLISFEFLLLQFESLVDWVFAKDDALLEKRKNLIDVRSTLLEILDGKESVGFHMNDSMRKYLVGMKNYNIEQICARLLFDITRNTGFEVSKSSIGPCWILDCCDWDDRASDDICGLDEYRLSAYDKMNSIFTKTPTLYEELKLLT